MNSDGGECKMKIIGGENPKAGNRSGNVFMKF